jgi:hypothetical protein
MPALDGSGRAAIGYITRVKFQFSHDLVNLGLLLRGLSSCRGALILLVKEVFLALSFRLDLALLRR